MTIYSESFDASEIIVQYEPSVALPKLEVMEVKGWGHPDKLADDLAESLSRVYSRYTLETCGAILHHNFDKLCILGGCSEVTYGKGTMLKPIRILINGRVSSVFAGKELPIDNLIIETCRSFFSERLPLINPKQDLTIVLNLSAASSPGRVVNKVINNGDTARHHWFAPRNFKDLPEHARLYANDTSLGTGYYPLSITERLVKALCDYLSKRPRTNCPQWLGTDVKVMAYAVGNQLDLTICAPQIAKFVDSKDQYIQNLAWLRDDIQSFVRNNFMGLEINIHLNARDNIETGELYLTALGSSIESGDEGVVGRGNRANGLITPMRPMNLEGVNGKNPVYHVGKVYNILASRIAKAIFDEFGCSATVNLISKTGSDLLSPWKSVVQIDRSDIPAVAIVNMVRRMCGEIPSITTEVINSSIEMLPLA